VQDLLLDRLGPRELRCRAALASDEDAIEHGQDLGQLGRDGNDRQAVAGQLVDQRVDLLLGQEVDASCRLVQQQDPAGR